MSLFFISVFFHEDILCPPFYTLCFFSFNSKSTEIFQILIWLCFLNDIAEKKISSVTPLFKHLPLGSMFKQFLDLIWLFKEKRVIYK